jgi:hypothetical protein
MALIGKEEILAALTRLGELATDRGEQLELLLLGAMTRLFLMSAARRLALAKTTGGKIRPWAPFCFAAHCVKLGYGFAGMPLRSHTRECKPDGEVGSILSHNDPHVAVSRRLSAISC